MEIDTRTLKLIEKAKERLASHSRFTWLKHLSVDEFIDFFFGLSEVSQYCRQTFVNTVNEISEEDLEAIAPTVPAKPLVAFTTPSVTPPPKRTEKRVEREEEELAGYLPPAQFKIVQVLKDSSIPLTARQIVALTDLSLKYVRYALSALSEKGVVQGVPNTHTWRVNLEVAQRYGRKEASMMERLRHFLAEQEEAVPTMEIVRRIGVKQRMTVSKYLWDLYKEGMVERIPIRHNMTLWKPTEALKNKYASFKRG